MMPEDARKLSGCDATDDKEVEAGRKGGHILKCILIRCMKTKVIFAHVIPMKGVDEDMYVANLVCHPL